MVVTELLNMSRPELDALFRTLDSGPIPDGMAKGTAIVGGGTAVSHVLARVVTLVAWQGKVFDATRGVLRNRILPFGLKAIVATVYKGPSWLDQKECIVIDYSKTSIVAGFVRDEIRMISSRLYLGRVYVGRRPLIHFTLELP